ncbi:DNA topoisomerase 1 [Nymphaea thermarum]|nr:DNA topoisomerase 1 [Nymphaea thermarum]
MAVHEPAKRQLIESSDDDDDRPLTFRRGSLSSRTKQLDPLVSRPPLKKPTTDIRAPSAQNSNFQADKGVSSTKVVVKKPFPATSQASSRSDANQSSNQAVVSNNKTKVLSRLSSAPSIDSDDSDDDRPLNFRRTMLTKVVPKPKPENLIDLKKEKISPTASSEDSEDDKPLALRAAVKPSNSAGISIKPEIDSDEEDKKPLSYKLQQNGSGRGLNGQLTSKANSDLKKRPLDEANRSSSVPSAKKAKTSSISLPAKVKVETGVKREPRESFDDEDYHPIAKGLKKSVADGNNSLAKRSPAKVTTSIKKSTKKLKKTLKNSKSQYGKSAKVPPGSGGGKKWTTLEHNGVIFPPPYKPHGVKMLYNGEPVDLTPEQEEVATMFALMKDTEYATKKTFIENFMNDWRVILGKNHKIKKFELCDFTPIYDWHQNEKEKKKQMSSESLRHY